MGENNKHELLNATASHLRNAGFAVSVNGAQIFVSLTNRKISTQEVTGLLDDEIPLEDIRSSSKGVIIDLEKW